MDLPEPLGMAPDDSGRVETELASDLEQLGLSKYEAQTLINRFRLSADRIREQVPFVTLFESLWEWSDTPAGRPPRHGRRERTRRRPRDLVGR